MFYCKSVDLVSHNVVGTIHKLVMILKVNTIHFLLWNTSMTRTHQSEVYRIDINFKNISSKSDECHHDYIRSERLSFIVEEDHRGVLFDDFC